MGWMAFIGSLVPLGWPIGIVVTVVILRRPIVAALGQGIQRLHVGPVDVVFAERLAEVKAEVAPELAEAKMATKDNAPGPDLDSLAASDPAAAVVTAFSRVEEALRALMDMAFGSDVPPMLPRGLAREAWKTGLITDEVLSAIEDLWSLRNLAAHGGASEISTKRAREFVAVADAVTYNLQRTMPVPNRRSGPAEQAAQSSQ